MDALSLMATLGLDSSDFEKGLSDSSSEAHSFASTIGDVMRSAINAVGEVISTIGDLGKKFVNAASEVAQYGDSIDKTSQKFGLSAQSYQEWDFILQHSGSSISAMRTGMRQLSSAVASGSDAFQKLGISQADVASMSQEELFSATISALQNIEDETQRTAIATELFGRSAQELGPLLNTSAEDTEAMRQRVHDLGGVMSDEAVKASARYQDSLQDMQYALNGVKNNMMANFLPGMATVMDGLADLFSGNGSGTAKIVEGIYSVVDNMRDLAPKLANRIKTTIKQVMPAIKVALKALVEIIGDLLPIIIDAITELVPIIAEALPGIIETTLPAILGALGTLVGSIITNLPAILSALWSGLKAALSSIWTSLSSLDWAQIGQNILTWITGALSNLGKKILEFLGVPTDEDGTLQEGWEGLAGKIGGWITGALETARNFVLGLLGVPTDEEGDGGQEAWSTAASNVGEWIKSGLDTASSFISGLLGKPPEGEDPSGWMKTANTVGGWIKDGIQWVVDFIDGIFNPPEEGEQSTTAQEWGTFTENIGKAIETAWTVSSELISGVFTAAQTAVENFPWADVGGKIGVLAGSVAIFGLTSMAKVFDAGTAAVEAFPWEDVGSKIGVLAGQIFIFSLTSMSGVFTAGQEAIDTFDWEGAGEKIGGLANEFVVLSADAISGVFESGAAAIDAFDWTGTGELIGELASEVAAVPLNGLSGVFQAANSTIRAINWEGLGERVAGLFDQATNITADMISGAFVTASETIQGIDWSGIGDDIANGLNRGWNIVAGLGSAALTVGEGISEGAQGGAEAFKRWAGSWFQDNPVEVETEPTMTAEEAQELGTQIETAIITAGTNGATSLETSLSDAGDKAALSIKIAIQSALNNVEIPDFSGGTINDGANGGGSYGAGRHKNASAMDSGTILHGLTPFGISPNGVIQYGGEAGPEAVVGVNSLNEMIQRSVSAAMANVQPMRQPINVQLLLDSGELLAAVDVGLNDRANWRGGGRA